MTLYDRAKDLRYALRSLRRSPGFLALAVGTLGLAIGVNAGIWTVVDKVLLDPLPYPDADRLVVLSGTAPGSDLPEEFGLSGEFYLHDPEQADLLAGISTLDSFTSTLRTDDRVERIRMSAPTAALFSTLQVQPILGRLPVPEDEDRVAVISHTLWQTWFGGDPAVIGRTYEISGRRRTVIGVMAEGFWFPDDSLLWIPSIVRPEDVVPGRFGAPLVARLEPGVTREALAEQLAVLARQLPERYGGSPAYARLIGQFRPIVRPLQEVLLGSVTRPLWVLLGAVAIVLLIACANVANLFMVRGERRLRDIAVRRALGATRAQLVRTQMAEAVVVAVLAGALALALAWASVPLLLRAAPEVPRLDQVAVGGPTILFTIAASALSALLCGLMPAVRSSTAELGRLRDGGRGSTRRRHWGRSALVVAQTAMALVLLIGSGLLIRSFRELKSVDPGYELDDLFTFQFAPERESLTDGPSWARFHLDFMERLRALPSVTSVGIVENVPLNEGVQRGRFRTQDMGTEADTGALLGVTNTAGDYFRTMGIELLQGRGFAPADPAAEIRNVVLSRSAAELLWPGQDPIGRRVQGESEGEEPWHTVVGVVEDVMQNDFRTKPEPLLYYPLIGPTPDAWAITTPAYVVKTKRAEEIAPEIRELVREVAPEAPMYRVFTMAGLAADSMVQLSFTMLTLGIASTLALILGAVGLFGVLSYVVAERTQEIGVRMALGAEAAQVRRMVLSQGARIAALGVSLGAIGAVAATRALGSLLYGVSAFDLATFVVMSAAMVVVALLASYLPARRASSVDPMVALRTE